ncbi:hypothetical protein DY000_02010786 [Brassica cretica]|uniref:JmjC domain-containing protein n=1 Tax=Brassica cretica TaxID=69181 RepID=A0ABQ7D069_BRACR|nr:hypothetical protein DY000_02010786 [Brassica cretica]
MCERDNGEALEKCDGLDDICLKTERLSPKYRSEDGPTVENGLMMPTLPSTPLWDEEDRPPQEQKLEAMPVRVQRLCMVVDHPIIDQTMFLSESQKKQLKKDYDIEPWTFQQHLGEAVFIPAGCPSSPSEEQTGFLSPQSVEECIRLTQEYKRLPKDHKFSKDKLEIQKIVLHAASSAIKEAQSLMQQNSRTQWWC